MMLRNAEKPDFTNARAVEVCAEAMTVSVQMYDKPYIYGILRKMVMEWIFLDPAVANFV